MICKEHDYDYKGMDFHDSLIWPMSKFYKCKICDQEIQRLFGWMREDGYQDYVIQEGAIERMFKELKNDSKSRT